MSEGLWIGDKNHFTTYVNPRLCEMLGYTVEELIGKHSYEFWDKDEVLKIKNIDNKFRKKGISSTYKGSLLAKDGSKVPVFISGAPLPDGGTIALSLDLTEVQKQTSFYENLVENMNEGVWMGDENYRTIYANPRFCQMMEYSLEEILGKNHLMFWDEKDAKSIRQGVPADIKKNFGHSYQGNLRSSSGKIIPVLVSGIFLDDGRVIGIVTDLTVLKEKEKAEKILSSAIQHANDAIIVFDSNREIRSWNNGARLIFGYKKEEIMHQKLDKLFSSDQISGFFKETGVFYNLELKSISKTARKLNIAATLTKVLSDDNKKLYYLLIARDITSQARFEEELSLKYEKIKEAYNQFGLIRRQMDYVFEILDLLDSSYDPKSIADYIVSSFIMLTRVDACVLRIYDSTKNSLDLVSSFGVEDWHGKATIKFSDSLAQKAFEKKSLLKIIDVSLESRYQSPLLAKKNNFHSLLLIPLQFQNALVGSLSLYIKPEKDMEIFDHPFLEKYAKVVGMAVSNVFFKKTSDKSMYS